MVRQISLSVCMKLLVGTPDQDLAQAGTCIDTFHCLHSSLDYAAGYSLSERVVIWRVIASKGVSDPFPIIPKRANCTKLRTNPGQFARFRSAKGCTCEVRQMRKWLNRSELTLHG